jgi:hypothetical protein
VDQAAVPSGWESLGLPMPEKPFPGQRRAPHCRPPLEPNIRGGCWIAVLNERPPCGDVSYEWKDICYVPSFMSNQQPTSELP